MKKNKSLIIITVVIVLAVIGAGLARLSSSDSEGTNADIATFTVKRGPLTISIIESGTIKAREQEIIKNEVEGRTSILTLIDEGTHVKKGDLLIELDSSELLDTQIDQEIRVENAESAFIRARENLAVAENQAKSDVDRAELDYEFAKQDIEKYNEGEYPNELKESESRITLAREELQRTDEKLEWSKRLYEENYLSQTELQADELAANKKKLDLELALSNLELLKNFTYKRNIAQLESDVSQAEMALERTKRKAKADVVQAEANLRATKSEYNRQQDKLKKIEEQIVKTKIYAPSDGQVIYATSAKGNRFRGNDEPLDEGRDVREREELIYLPTTSSVNAEVNIHESSMDKIRLDMPATVTVDALPGKAFTGHVEKIAPLPDPTSVWLNPDLKVYNTDIFLDNNDETLRTGMSCKAEIIIERYDNAIYVPVQAVLRVKGSPTVYVVNGKTHEPRKVQMGLDNNRMVHITSGLDEGEVVMLAPPLAEGSVEDQRETIKAPQPVEEAEIRPGPERSEGKRPQREGDQQEERRRGRRQGAPDMQNMSPEQMQKMKERFEKMTPEERQKAMEGFRKRSSSETGNATNPSGASDE
jgi:HlyD family secretion protein